MSLNPNYSIIQSLIAAEMMATNGAPAIKSAPEGAI
jgi:hypothetical protein